LRGDQEAYEDDFVYDETDFVSNSEATEMGKIEEVDEEEDDPENKENIDSKIAAYKKKLDNKTNNIQ